MLFQTPISVYRQAARAAARSHLAGLGFSLKKERFGTLVAESKACRVLFDPRQFILLVQRVSGNPRMACPAYDLPLLLEASGSDAGFEISPMPNPGALRGEVDRMVRLLVESCLPILEGDDAAWQRARELASEKEDQILAQLGETGLRLKEDEGWRELPELESVRAKGANKLVNALIGLLLLAVPGGYTLFLLYAYGCALFGPPQADTLVAMLCLTAFGIPMALLDIWIVKNVLLCQYYWETSGLGLTVGGFVKKQFIPWSDVESVVLLPRLGHEFRTSKRSIRLEKGALKHVSLEASIWQHLNRLGKADALPLSAFAMSLWAQIPDEKVEEIQWENPTPPHALDIVLRFALWEALIWGIGLQLKLELVSQFLAVAVWPLAPALLDVTAIKRITVDADRIVAGTGLGKVSLRWKSVRSVMFLNRWFRRPASLLIRAGAFGFIRIPWIPEHPNSTRVMLAILKRLRQEERFKLLAFPSVLLLAAHGGEPGDDS